MDNKMDEMKLFVKELETVAEGLARIIESVTATTWTGARYIDDARVVKSLAVVLRPSDFLATWNDVHAGVRRREDVVRAVCTFSARVTAGALRARVRWNYDARVADVMTRYIAETWREIDRINGRPYDGAPSGAGVYSMYDITSAMTAGYPPTDISALYDIVDENVCETCPQATSLDDETRRETARALVVMSFSSADDVARVLGDELFHGVVTRYGNKGIDALIQTADETSGRAFYAEYGVYRCDVARAVIKWLTRRAYIDDGGRVVPRSRAYGRYYKR